MILSGESAGAVVDHGGFLLALLAAVAAAAVAVFFWRGWHRLAEAPVPAALVPPLAAAVAFLGLLVAGSVGAECTRVLFLGGLPREELAAGGLEVRARLLMGGYTTQGLMALVILVASRAGRAPPAEAGRASPRPLNGLRAAATGAGALLVFWPLVALATLGLGKLVERLQGPLDPIAHDTLRLIAERPGAAWSIVTALLVVCVTPVIEELAYRGLLQRLLADVGLGRWPAIALTSAVFAAPHADVAAPHAVGGLFVLALGLGWVYEKTGRLLSAIVMHGLFNAGNVVATWLMAPA